MPSSDNPGSEWKAKPLLTTRVGNSSYTAAALKSPDGTVFYGISEAVPYRHGDRIKSKFLVRRDEPDSIERLDALIKSAEFLKKRLQAR